MTWRAFSVNAEGAALHGERRDGDGAPLVLIHGMGGSLRMWDRLVAALPPELPLIRYDLRGFGASTADEGTPFSHSDDLLVVLDTLAVERSVPVGLSMGGGVALNFALSHPSRVDRLVLASPAMVGWEWSDEWKAIWRSVSEPARAGDMATARERWWMHPMFAEVRARPEGGEFRAEIEGYHGRQWVCDDQRAELPDVDRLHALAVPTLLLTGERDVADIRLIADVIAAAAPDVQRIYYPAAGHMLHLERTRAMASAIAEFVRR